MYTQLYQDTCLECSRVITRNYSTSFTLGIKTLHKRYRAAIYGIYGFVRYADEIVDTFYDHNQKYLLEKFKADTYAAIEAGISLNPVLHSFQWVVNEYKVNHALIEAFLLSMEMDLYKNTYTKETYDQYIYGSAEVVGLMCLHVFCEGDNKMFESLRGPAQSLGKAFQKVNFLRDMKSDYMDRGRVYFPGIDFQYFNEQSKAIIEQDIQNDFDHAYTGIVRLPEGARNGVYLAYVYYKRLFQKICDLSPSKVLQERIRVPDNQKLAILVKTFFQAQLNFI